MFSIFGKICSRPSIFFLPSYESFRPSDMLAASIRRFSSLLLPVGSASYPWGKRRQRQAGSSRTPVYQLFAFLPHTSSFYNCGYGCIFIFRMPFFTQLFLKRCSWWLLFQPRRSWAVLIRAVEFMGSLSHTRSCKTVFSIRDFRYFHECRASLSYLVVKNGFVYEYAKVYHHKPSL